MKCYFVVWIWIVLFEFELCCAVLSCSVLFLFVAYCEGIVNLYVGCAHGSVAVICARDAAPWHASHFSLKSFHLILSHQQGAFSFVGFAHRCKQLVRIYNKVDLEPYNHDRQRGPRAADLGLDDDEYDDDDVSKV
jgi:hypothetical protein